MKDLSEKVVETYREELGNQQRINEDRFDENDKEIHQMVEEKCLR